jgi:hypothetical protein
MALFCAEMFTILKVERMNYMKTKYAVFVKNFTSVSDRKWPLPMLKVLYYPFPWQPWAFNFHQQPGGLLNRNT